MPLRNLIFLLWVALAPIAAVRDAASQSPGTLEIGGQYYQLTGDFDPWRGVRVAGIKRVSPRDNWFLEANFFERFGDRSFFYKVQNNRDVGRSWRTSAALGVSSGGFFTPRFVVDAGVARKWGGRGSVVSGVTVGLYSAKDEHKDYHVSADLAVYTIPGLLIQGGVRWNYSTPGEAVSRYHYAALTHHREGSHSVSLRYAFGDESYLVTSPLNIFTNFRSWEVGATWRQWVYAGWGFRVSASLYHNPFYERTGATFGVFHDF